MTENYIPLQLKYRPKKIADLVGQSVVQLALSNSIERAKIANAYLFYGARGTGKTSAARIMAMSLNCYKSHCPTISPCGECAACQSIAKGDFMDVIELDAASNNGVDEARKLISNTKLAPVRGRYKVFIIDEAHELTSRAQNTLLKTLEEPPANVVFMLCTTEPEKILDTIVSRCQSYRFKRVSAMDTLGLLHQVVESEALQASDPVLEAIALASEGGLRNALTLLDKLALSGEEITLEQVDAEAGQIPEATLIKVMTALYTKNVQKLVLETRSLMSEFEANQVMEALIRVYRDLSILALTSEAKDLVGGSGKYLERLTAIAQDWGLAKIHQGLDILMEAESQLRVTAYPVIWADATLIRLGGIYQ